MSGKLIDLFSFFTRCVLIRSKKRLFLSRNEFSSDIFDRDNFKHIYAAFPSVVSTHDVATQEFLSNRRTIRICTGGDGQSSIIIRRSPRGDA